MLHAVHISSGYLDLFYAHCTDQIAVCSLACNKMEVSGRQLCFPNKNCYSLVQNVALKFRTIDIQRGI
jgi:hypothetical protein